MRCRAFPTISRIIYSAISTRVNKSHIVDTTVRIHKLRFDAVLKGAQRSPKKCIALTFKFVGGKMCGGAKFYAKKKVSIARCILLLCDVILGEAISQNMTTSMLAEKHKSFHFLRTCGTNYSFLIYRITFATTVCGERVKCDDSKST